MRKEGKPLPEWAIEPWSPTPQWDAFFMTAFYDLDTERPMGFAIGPIPWSKIHVYGALQGLRGIVLEGFVAIIRRMDAAFLADVRAQQEEARKAKEAGGG